jgi:hypothetical protein
MFKHDFGQADIVVCFLMPEMLQKFSQKLMKHRKKEQIIFSNSFQIPNLDLMEEVKTGKGLLFKNVAVVYKDEINAVHRERIDLSIPAVEPSWYQPAIRKKLSLWLDEQNILPTMIMQVALPSSGGKEFDMEARFLDVPIDEFTKEDVVNAAIYHRCRTVKSALGFDEEEMRHSLFMYLHNLDKIETGEDFTPVPYDPSYKVPAK